MAGPVRAPPCSGPTVVDLLRHGAPEGGPCFRGAQDDPLSAEGWRQMEAALPEPRHWDLILSSPMRRCLAFAQSLAEAEGIPLHTEPRLREIGFGEWEGLTTAAVEAKQPELLERFWHDPERYPPPGAEPLANFRRRTLAAWDDWTTRLAGQRVLLVSHGGNIRVILSQVLCPGRDTPLQNLAIPYACRSRVQLDPGPHGTLCALMAHVPAVGS